jgi:hypothetical protein
MVAVVDGALAAAISGIAMAAFSGPEMSAAIPVGLIVGIATTAALMWTSVRRGRRVMGTWEARFPTPGTPTETVMGLWGAPSAHPGGEDGDGQARP